VDYLLKLGEGGAHWQALTLMEKYNHLKFMHKDDMAVLSHFKTGIKQ
jgi:hypothetical protein